MIFFSVLILPVYTSLLKTKKYVKLREKIQSQCVSSKVTKILQSRS